MGSTRDAGGPEWLSLFQADGTEEPSLPPGLADAQGVVLFGQASTSAVARRLKGRIEAPAYWLQSFPNESPKRHVTDFLADQATVLGLPLLMEPVRLVPDPAELATARERISLGASRVPRKLVVVHPGSGGIRKVWPLSRWKMLMQRLGAQPDTDVLVVVGPADEKIRPAVEAIAVSLGLPVIDDLELPALAALLSLCDLYVGNDSGATHLAASMGAPVVAVFGPTDPDVWAPRGRHVHIIRDQWHADEILEPRLPAAALHSASRVAALAEGKLAESRGRR